MLCHRNINFLRDRQSSTINIPLQKRKGINQRWGRQYGLKAHLPTLRSIIDANGGVKQYSLLKFLQMIIWNGIFGREQKDEIALMQYIQN